MKNKRIENVIKWTIISILMVIVVFHSIKFIFFTPNVRNCISEKASEEYIAGACPYYLNEKDLELVMKKGIQKFNSNRIRESYVAMMPDNSNPNAPININKRKILEECYQNNGCLLSYIDAYKQGLYGLNKDNDKVVEAYHKMITDSYNSKNYYEYMRYLIAYRSFINENKVLRDDGFWTNQINNLKLLKEKNLLETEEYNEWHQKINNIDASK